MKSISQPLDNKPTLKWEQKPVLANYFWKLHESEKKIGPGEGGGFVSLTHHTAWIRECVKLLL